MNKKRTSIMEKIRAAAYHLLYFVLARRKTEKLLRRAKKIIDSPKIKVVSFDIFDTCLNRLCYYPHDVFYLAFRQTDNYATIYHERCRADSELRRKGSQYPTFEDIWRYVATKCHLSNQQVHQLSQREIQLEKYLSSARKPIMELYEYALRSGKRIIAVSDMYLDRHTLGDMLSQAGYHNPDKIYVSCDIKGSKSDGKLYDYVLEQEQVTSPRQVFHIGNDFVSDSWKAQRKGFRHLCIPSPYQLFLYSSINASRNTIKHLSSVQERCLLGHILNACEEDGGLSFKRAGLNSRTFSKAIVFPLLFRIGEFILQSEEIQTNYHEIYFVSRDGWLPMKGYQMMRDYYGKGLPAVYLFGSRQFCKMSQDEQKNRRIREYYQNTLKLKNHRAIIYDIGYNGSVSRISDYFDTECIIDKIYIWQTDVNKTVDKKLNSKTFTLDNTVYNNLRTCMEPIFANPEEGHVVDIIKNGEQFVPVHQPFKISESREMAIDEIHSNALSLLSSYMPYKSLAMIPDILDISFFSKLIYHYFGSVFHSSSTCLKPVALDRYIRKEAWNQYKGVYILKSFLYRFLRRNVVK